MSPPPSPLTTAPLANAGSRFTLPAPSASSQFPIPLLSTSPGPASPSIVCSLPWISPTPNSTRHKASSSRSFSIPLPPKNFLRAAVTPSPNSPPSPKTANLYLLLRSPLPSKPTSLSNREKSNPATSSPNFPAPIQRSRMSSSSSPPISTISVSALPSTGTAFTTAPWTTPPAVPSFSTSRPASTPIPKNSADPSSSFSSPLKKKDSSARAISPLIRPSLQNPSSPTLTSTCFFRSFPLNFSK